MEDIKPKFGDVVTMSFGDAQKISMKAIDKKMKDTNKEQTLEQFEKYKGQFVIKHNFPSDIVVRFIGIGYDDMDYLYIFYDGRKLSYATILDRIIPLKGFISDKDYNEYIRLWNLNSDDKPNNTKLSDEKYEMARDFYRNNLEDEIVSSGITLFDGLCWEVI